jgi:hypothetical protein
LGVINLDAPKFARRRWAATASPRGTALVPPAFICDENGWLNPRRLLCYAVLYL